MRLVVCLGFVLAATAANAQTYTTVVSRDAKTATTTGPGGTTVTTTQVARTAAGATYSTTITHPGAYQPMGAGGYHPMGH
jgi:hypothetical protein